MMGSSHMRLWTTRTTAEQTAAIQNTFQISPSYFDFWFFDNNELDGKYTTISTIADDFPSVDVAQMGFGGGTWKDLLFHMSPGEVSKYNPFVSPSTGSVKKPKAIVVVLGTNDIAGDVDYDPRVGLRTFVQWVTTNMPSTKVVLITPFVTIGRLQYMDAYGELTQTYKDIAVHYPNVYIADMYSTVRTIYEDGGRQGILALTDWEGWAPRDYVGAAVAGDDIHLDKTGYKILQSLVHEQLVACCSVPARADLALDNFLPVAPVPIVNAPPSPPAVPPPPSAPLIANATNAPWDVTALAFDVTLDELKAMDPCACASSFNTGRGCPQIMTDDSIYSWLQHPTINVAGAPTYNPLCGCGNHFGAGFGPMCYVIDGEECAKTGKKITLSAYSGFGGTGGKGAYTKGCDFELYPTTITPYQA